jgi:hypothetical protein
MLQNKPACVVYCRRTPTRLAGGKLLHSRSRFYESIWENSKNDIAAIRVTRPNRVKERHTTENIESGLMTKSLRHEFAYSIHRSPGLYGRSQRNTLNSRP